MNTTLLRSRGRSLIGNFARAPAALALCATTAPPALADGARGDDGYAIGLWGDLPYSTLQATAGVPKLIADMNARGMPNTVSTRTRRRCTPHCR